MKKLIAIVTLAFTATLATAQNQPYMFTGKLNSQVAITTNCGTEASAYAFEFEVTMISDNSYTDQNIAILVKCPENYGADFFKVGGTYKMELFDAAGSTYVIMNQGILDNYSLPHNYWAGDIKAVH